MAEGDETDKRESGIGTAGVEADEATGQVPVGRQARKQALDKDADTAAGRGEDSVRRVLEAPARDKR